MEIFTQWFDGMTVQYHVATMSFIIAAVTCLLTLLFGFGRYELIVPTILVPAILGACVHGLGFVFANVAQHFWGFSGPDFLPRVLPHVGPLVAATAYGVLTVAFFMGMRRTVDKIEKDVGIKRDV